MKTTVLQAFLLLNLAVGFASLHQFVSPPSDSLATAGTQSPDIVEFPIVTTLEMVEHLKNGDAVFLDARSSKEFEQGFIPGATSAPMELGASLPLLESLKGKGAVVVYCTGTGCKSSLTLARELAAQGIKNISLYEEGWKGWTEAGMPTMKLSTPPTQ